MKSQVALWLAGFAAGRIALHCYLAQRYGRWSWHWAGIARELRG
ncbi:MAG: hypothetical protein ABSA97_14185 [Verrucomicrobiia bacterium]